MNTRTINSARRVTVGTIVDVDLVNRTIKLLAGPLRLTFDVPPPCEIVLNGERVKLRVLQSGDTVAVIQADDGEAPVIRIEVANRDGIRRAEVSAWAD